MTVTLILQIATLVVATVSPFIAFRHARKLAISGNKQAWLDALREDVAKIISISDEAATFQILRGMKNKKYSLEDDSKIHQDASLFNKNLIELQLIRYRIRLRLRAGNILHDELISVLFGPGLVSTDDKSRAAWREAVVTATEAIIQKEALPDETLIPIILLTQITLEKEMNAAIAAIEALDTVNGKVNRIRLETLENK